MSSEIGHKKNENKIKTHQKNKIKQIGDNIFKSHVSEKLNQQSSIAYLKVRNPANLPNVFAKTGQYVDFRVSSDFDKIDSIDDLVLWMQLDVQCNFVRESVADNYYILPAVLLNSVWLIDRVEFYVSGTLYDTQHAVNLHAENSYKSNNDLRTEKDGGGFNSNYLEFDDNINSIVYPNNTTYVPSLVAPTPAQCTQRINRTLRFGRNLINKFLLKATNDEFTIRVFFNTTNNIVTGNPASDFGILRLNNSLLYMQGIKYSPIELQKQLLEKYINKEYIFTSVVRKYNGINFSNITPFIRQSADIGNFAGTFSTFAAYLNYQNAVGSKYNQNSVSGTAITYSGVTPNRVPVFDTYRLVSVPNSNGLRYIADNGATHTDALGNVTNNINPNYTETREVFEMELTLQDGNGDSYPYERNMSDLVLKNFSSYRNYSDYIKKFSLYPFNFGSNANKNYWDQNINDGHYLFDNSSTLIFNPTSQNIPSDIQLFVVGTQLCQCSIKDGRVNFKYL